MNYASFNPELDPHIADNRFKIKRVGTFAGAEITGLDLTQTLAPETIEALKLALQISDELQRYEVSDYQNTRSLIPEWAQDLGRIAKTVGKDILR